MARFRLSVAAILLSLTVRVYAQSPATVRVDVIPILTYPYSEPDPVPMLVKDTRLYPYHGFGGLTNEPVEQNWHVVVLENDFVKVFVLPEAGGKVWGAIEKTTGEEFIYRNEVMKFRNIALRGPWTSGGIEFNFGVIGHTPSTASPVDYALKTNEDGSVSCFVGAMDLPSRTQWRVEIRLPADKSFFETNTTWYNPTPVEQPYYNWMTAAAFAKDDLVLSIPGDRYLKHSGEVLSWPVDAFGRDLSKYANNTFDGHKSYHVVGEYDDFFGGYYTTRGYGFGHWSEYSDMPGQKLWLWALSRQGEIWEDLLTDSDGQYVEFQAGRLFVQYSPGDHVNPITQVGFEPYRTDRWTERWFPVVGIGGLDAASADGAMSVRREGSALKVGVNSFGFGKATLKVLQSGRLVHEAALDLAPMAVLMEEVLLPDDGSFVIEIEDLDLFYRSAGSPGAGARLLDRPFVQDASAQRGIPKPDRQFFAGRELMKARWYRDARVMFDSVLAARPWHQGALLAVAELEYRAARYSRGLTFANRVRQVDAYHPRANYLAGILYRGSGDNVNAAEAFGWASRSMEFRAVAIAQLAEVSLIEKDYTRAVAYARQALDYDAYSVNAIETLAIALRLAGEKDRAAAALSRLTDVDHLSHFVDFERFLSGGSGSLSAAFEDAIRAEFRDQTYVELALSYYNRGQVDEADRIFRMGNENGGNEIARIWVAYLSGEVLSSADVAARPYRPETARALEWLVAQDGAWQWKYLLALNYWALDRVEEASDLMTALVDAPDEPSVYIARAALLQTANGLDQGSDLRRALSVDDSQRVTWLHLQRYYEDAGAWEDALELSQDMFSRFPSDFVVRLARARALLRNEQPLEAIAVLQDTQVLPAEGAGDGRTLYSQANTLAGIRAVDAGDCFGARSFLLEALEWPEHLGQGRPYEPDERLPRFLLLYCQSLGTTDATVLDDYEAHRRYYEEALSGGAESIDGFEMTLVQKALNATHE